MSMLPNPGNGWAVELSKHGNRWSYTVRNPDGGSSGGSERGTQEQALRYALRVVPKGAEYRLVVNGRDRGMHRKP